MKKPERKDLVKISDYIWEIPKSFREDMQVPARIFASEKMFDDILEDQSLWQLVNASTLPTLYKYALAMPDIHEGYGVPVGSVIASEYENGIISPGAIGFDINCGVRLLVADLNYKEVKNKIPKLTEEIFREVPSGVGRGGWWKLNNDEMGRVLEEGAKYIYELGYADKEDLEATESYGRLEGEADMVSKTAKDRGRDQLGTMGAGNHFVEIQKIHEVYDEKIGEKLGIVKGRISILIHCGSRGLGHQVCSDYVREFLREIDKKNIDLIDKELAYSNFHSGLGQRYFKAMNSSANFAWANRQLIAYEVRKAFQKIFGKSISLKQVYDVAHNIAKVENHEGKKLIVHRKGATRAFWQGHLDLAPKFREIGQPILIPGSMGTASYILIGNELAEKFSFGSGPHGAGRVMSRAEAKRKIKGTDLKEELESKGITVSAGSMSGLAEESPSAYKDVNEVVDVITQIGAARKVAKLVPVGVIKG